MRKVRLYKYNKPLLVLTSILCALGLLILFSAALGELNSTVNFYRIMLVQLVGLALGFAVIFVAISNKKVDYRCFYKKYYALYFFVFCIIFQLLVFSPIGIERKGATRWVDVGVTTVQPSEFLKIGLILFLASLLVGFKKEIKSIKYLSILLVSSVGFVALLMLLIRDKGTLIIIGLASLAMLLVSKASNKHIAILALAAMVALGGLISLNSNDGYARDRILSYLNIIESPTGQDYQINQAIVTIGSGQISGKGYGQSVQKHKYLPETLNDSIFAIYAEEWGFMGSVLLVVLFLLFAWYGLAIARNARDEYGRYIVVGLTVLITAQAFFNIAALMKLVPLSGMPLIFISKGGSSLLASLIMVAIILNVSRFNKSS